MEKRDDNYFNSGYLCILNYYYFEIMLLYDDVCAVDEIDPQKLSLLFVH